MIPVNSGMVIRSDQAGVRPGSTTALIGPDRRKPAAGATVDSFVTPRDHVAVHANPDQAAGPGDTAAGKERPSLTAPARPAVLPRSCPAGCISAPAGRSERTEPVASARHAVVPGCTGGNERGTSHAART